MITFTKYTDESLAYALTDVTETITISERDADACPSSSGFANYLMVKREEREAIQAEIARRERQRHDGQRDGTIHWFGYHLAIAMGHAPKSESDQLVWDNGIPVRKIGSRRFKLTVEEVTQ